MHYLLGKVDLIKIYNVILQKISLYIWWQNIFCLLKISTIQIHPSPLFQVRKESLQLTAISSVEEVMMTRLAENPLNATRISHSWSYYPPSPSKWRFQVVPGPIRLHMLFIHIRCYGHCKRLDFTTQFIPGLVGLRPSCLCPSWE